MPSPEPFRLLKRYPLLCGLWSFALKSHAQKISIKFLNTTGSAMFTTHLYNAVLAEGVLLHKWPDMEQLLGYQNPDAFFVGDPPSHLPAYCKHLELSLGASLVNFARDRRNTNRRHHVDQMSSRGALGLSELGAVSQLCCGRYCNNQRSVAWSRESIMPVLESKFEYSDDIKDSARDGYTVSYRPPPRRPGQKLPTGLIIRKPTKDRGNTHSMKTFLNDFWKVLLSEAHERSFDYLRIHISCWKLLRRVNELCQPELTRILGPGYLPTEKQLPFVVLHILEVGEKTAQAREELNRQGLEPVTPLLILAATAFQEFLATAESDVVLRTLEALGFKSDLSSVFE